MPKNDFNGDGLSDLLWRRADGLTAIWYSTGTSFSSFNTFSQLVATDWAIAGTGDFNGDGKGDILWRKADGQLTVWSSNGATFDATFNQMVTTDWAVVATGDFNGDDRSDILWRRSDGLVTTWLADGSGRFTDARAPLGQVGPEWKVEDTGDVSGDGFDDVIWRKTDGQMTVWSSNGTVPVQDDAWNQYIYRGPNWTVAVGQFVSDDREDLVLSYWSSQISSSNTNGPTEIWFTNDTVFRDHQGTGDKIFSGNPPELISGDFGGSSADDVAFFGSDHFLKVFLVDPTPTSSDGWVSSYTFYSAIPAEWSLITV